MTRRLVFTPDALADLEAIFRSIASDNPRRARSYVGDIEDACAKLCDMPHIGPERHDLRPGLRLLARWKRIVVAYEVTDERIDVLRIFSGGRDYEAIMAGDV